MALAMVLASCQPLPQPFQPAQSKKEGNPLLKLPDRAGVLIRPVEGMSPDAARALSDAVAAALVKRNIPAFTTSSNRQSLVLGGRVNERGTTPRIDWRLYKEDMSGGKIVRIVTAAPSERTEEFASIAARTAAAIAALIQRPALRDRTAHLKKRYLYIAPISGPPRDASAVLRDELEAALRRQALRVSTTVREDSLAVAGNIKLLDSEAGKKRMSVDWAVLRKDGRELGNLSQSNDVTPVELDRDWPAIAREIAVSAAKGLRELLDKIPEKAIEPPPTER